MFRFVSYLPILLIIFPAVEVYLLFSWFGDSFWSALVYTVVSMTAGVLCIKVAKTGMREVMSRLRGEQINFRALLVFGKMWFIGILLFFPGYLTDIIAALIWLLSGGISHKNSDSDSHARPRRRPADDDGIVEVEGDFVDENLDDKPR